MLKYSNGLLIQWGSNPVQPLVLLPFICQLLFMITNYVIHGCIIKDAYDENVYTATSLVNPTVSSFRRWIEILVQVLEQEYLGQNTVGWQ